MPAISLAQVLEELRKRNEAVPLPRRLPTAAEVTAMEAQLGASFHPDYRRYLLEASDVAVGTLEPATITNAQSHTYLPKVVQHARAFGVPPGVLPICEDNANFYCFTPAGSVVYWAHDGMSREQWPSLAAWVAEVWLGERA